MTMSLVRHFVVCQATSPVKQTCTSSASSMVSASSRRWSVANVRPQPMAGEYEGQGAVTKMPHLVSITYVACSSLVTMPATESPVRTVRGTTCTGPDQPCRLGA